MFSNQGTREAKSKLKTIERKKRNNVISSQIQDYSKTLNVTLDVNLSNLPRMMALKISELMHQGSSESEKNEPIAETKLTLPDSRLKKIADTLKDTIESYQVYDKTEAYVKKGLQVAAVSASASPTLVGKGIAAGLNLIEGPASDIIAYSSSLITFNIMQAMHGPDRLVYDEKHIQYFWEGLTKNQQKAIQLLSEAHFQYLVDLEKNGPGDKIKRDNYNKSLIVAVVNLTNIIAEDMQNAISKVDRSSLGDEIKSYIKSFFNRSETVSSYDLQSRI